MPAPGVAVKRIRLERMGCRIAVGRDAGFRSREPRLLDRAAVLALHGNLGAHRRAPHRAAALEEDPDRVLQGCSEARRSIPRACCCSWSSTPWRLFACVGTSIFDPPAETRRREPLSPAAAVWGSSIVRVAHGGAGSADEPQHEARLTAGREDRSASSLTDDLDRGSSTRCSRSRPPSAPCRWPRRRKTRSGSVALSGQVERLLEVRNERPAAAGVGGDAVVGRAGAGGGQPGEHRHRYGEQRCQSRSCHHEGEPLVAAHFEPGGQADNRASVLRRIAFRRPWRSGWHRDQPGRRRGVRRAPVRPLPRGVRGRRRVQALAGQDRDRGGRPTCSAC